MNTTRREVLLSGLALTASGLAFAQSTYPSQPVKIVVGFPAGGSTDQVARFLADGLTEQMKRPFVVDNRAGASGNLAAGQVARAQGDGHTLLLTAVGLATTAAFNPTILQAHPTKDLAPISLLAFTPNVLLASEQSGFTSVKDVLEFAKENPGQLNFGHSGYGGGLHLSGEVFSIRSGAKMNQIPYKGVAPMKQDLLGGQIPLGWDNLCTALPLIKSGKVRALAISSSERAPELRDVPTFKELGYEGMEFGAWFGLSGPTTLPASLAKEIAAQVNLVLASPSVKKRFDDAAIQILASKAPEEYRAYVDADIARWHKVVVDANVKP